MSAAKRPSTPKPFQRVVLPFVALSFLLAACGGGEDGTSVGVASLEDVAVADSAETDDTGAGDDAAGESGEMSPDEALLAFSQCMRDAGFDFPDIGINADGNPDIRDAFGEAGINPRDEDVRTALQDCRTHIEDAGFGGGRRAGLADNVEIADALVEFSACVREDGWDVGDLELGGGQGGGGNGGAPADGGGEGAGGEGRGGNAEGGQRGGGFRAPGERLARGLGLDPEDPAVQATMEKCQPIVTEAFAAAGIGRN